MATALRRGATPEVARPEPKRDPEQTETRGGPVERSEHRAAPRAPNGREGTLEGNKAHGRIGRSRIGNGAGTLRTRRWSKASKPTAPPPETPPRGDTDRTARDPPRKGWTSSTGDAQETPADDHPRGWTPACPKVTCLGRRPRTRDRPRDPRRSRDPGATSHTTHPSHDDLPRQSPDRRSGTPARPPSRRESVGVRAPRGPNVERRDGGRATPSGRPGEGDERRKEGNLPRPRTNDRRSRDRARRERSRSERKRGEQGTGAAETTGRQGLR